LPETVRRRSESVHSLDEIFLGWPTTLVWLPHGRALNDLAMNPQSTLGAGVMLPLKTGLMDRAKQCVTVADNSGVSR
jgi:hypothetical protein